MKKHRFEFWLDEDKPEENELMGKIEALKDRNKFASTVRKGLMLVPTLEAGDFDTLVQMYPDVVQKLIDVVVGQGAIVVTATPPKPPDVDYDKLTTEIAEKVVLMGGANRLEMSASQNVEPPRKQLGQGIQQQLSAPVYDDDDLPMMKITKDTKTDAGANFLKGVMGLQ